ncbi:MAG TPA: hypothetical protein VLJ19_08705 [Variovorax sp.]|nr:hypothetical protein [Variovorax sp.]
MKKRFLMTALASAVLAGCGGGGGGDGGTPPSTVSSTTIAGTAATGAAIAGATVQAKCATGGGSAVTGADGRFSLKIDNAVRPCVLSVSAPGGTTLHSVVEGGSGTDVVANITPLTELITASLAGGSTASFFSTFDAAAQAKLTQEGLSGAKQSVTLALKGIVDLAGIDPVKDTLLAANGGNAGNALDQKLDALGTALAAAQITLTEVSAAVAANPGSAAPLQTILQPAAASCAGLRNGNYRTIQVTTDHYERVRVDSAALTVTYESDNAVDTLTDAGGCQFGIGGAEPETLLVNKSGVAIMREGAPDSPAAVEVIIPEQTIALSELAGTWNALGYESDGPDDPYKAAAITFTFDAAGQGSAGAECEPMNSATCTPWVDQFTATANADGGFNFTDPLGTVRAFAFKSADGKLSLFINALGRFFVASKQEAAQLQVVGNSRKWWDLVVNDRGDVAPVTPGEMEVLTVDAVNKSYTRRRPDKDNSIETMRFDNPRPGMSYRAANSTTTSDGGATQHPGIVALGVPGTGLSVVTNLTTAPGFVFAFSLNKP